MKNIALSFKTSFFYALSNGQQYTEFISIKFITLLIISYIIYLLISNLILKEKRLSNKDKKCISDMKLFLFGIIALILAVFPYVAVGKLPALSGFGSRHQLLVPLGAAVMIVYGFKLLFQILNFNLNSRIYIYSIFIVLFVYFNINNALAY